LVVVVMLLLLRPKLLSVANLGDDFCSRPFGAFFLWNSEIGTLKIGLATILTGLASCTADLATMASVTCLFDRRASHGGVSDIKRVVRASSRLKRREKLGRPVEWRRSCWICAV
jgi:hypothetical protein